MKNAYEILSQKKEELARVRREIDSLKIVAALLEDESTLEEGKDESKEKKSTSEEKSLDVRLDLDTLNNDGLFSSIERSRSRFWKAFTRAS